MTMPASQRMELRRVLLCDMDDLARRLYYEGYEAGKADADKGLVEANESRASKGTSAGPALRERGGERPTAERREGTERRVRQTVSTRFLRDDDENQVWPNSRSGSDRRRPRDTKEGAE